MKVMQATTRPTSTATVRSSTTVSVNTASSVTRYGMRKLRSCANSFHCPMFQAT